MLPINYLVIWNTKTCGAWLTGQEGWPYREDDGNDGQHDVNDEQHGKPDTVSTR